MKRHTAKHCPKHVRRLQKRLSRAGFVATVETTHRGYLLSWRAANQRMRLGVGPSHVGDSIDRLWANIRAMFRARRLRVPA